MLDQVLAWVVVAAPTLFALGLELMEEKHRKSTVWRFCVGVLGVSLSFLTWLQQSRSVAANKAELQSITTKVAAETSATVTSNLSQQYQTVMGGLYKEIGSLEAQIKKQADISRESLSLNYQPSMDLVYVGDKLQLWNRGKMDVTYWGSKYGALGASREKPFVIPPTTNMYMLTEQLHNYIKQALGDNGDVLVPFDVYISTANDVKYVLHTELREVVSDGKIVIHTQNRGFEKRDWSR